MADRRELVHEGDVEIALRVLDHLGGFGHLDRGRLDAGGYDRAVDRGDDVGGGLVLAGQHLADGLEPVRSVARIDALG